MKLFWACFATAMVAAISAFAGGLGDALVETAPVVMSPDETGGSSVASWVVPVAIIAVLLGAAALSGDSNDSGAS